MPFFTDLTGEVMGRDDPKHDARDPAQASRADRMAACARELTEALTALGNWLATVHLETERTSGPPSHRLRRAIEESRAQQRRAGRAIRELRDLLRDTTEGD